MEQRKAVVWSKNNCSACAIVKNMLKVRDFEIEERNIEANYTIEDLRAVVPNARMLPQVFINDEYIGGLNDVMRRLA